MGNTKAIKQQPDRVVITKMPKTGNAAKAAKS